MKVYRGNASAARSYVEQDRSRVDDYYLAEGSGLADRFVAEEGVVSAVGAMDGDTYEAWVAGLDPDSREPRGRLRHDDRAVRFVEVVVNGPKTWSLAAALDAEVGEAYDRAQDRAASQIVSWLSEHATTRVGPRGRQVQVPVERLEAAVVRHYTSRAGDPHRHLHLQINARVFAAGKWRGLHTVGVRDSIDAINGIGHAAVMTDPEFRRVLAEKGFTLDPQTGEVRELARFTGAFSARARQIGRNVEKYERAWREENPGREPGAEVLRTWDRRAWAQARPDKVTPADGEVLTDRWVGELRDLGYLAPHRMPYRPSLPLPGSLDRDAIVATALTRLGARRSAWNSANIRGQVEQLIAATGLATEAAVRAELAEDLTARAVASSVPLLAEPDTAEHIRALTSHDVLAVERDLNRSFAARAEATGRSTTIAGEDLDPAQRKAAAAMADWHRLVVVEGAAGSGKTATLAATNQIVNQRGQRMVIVTPTLKAAQVAAAEVGTRAYSAAWLAHQYGFSWNDDGAWSRQPSTPTDAATLRRGDLLLVDEAGMLDQDTARALTTIADETSPRLALVGDRHQLPAVGRGGVLDLAIRWATPDAHLTLDTVHRFADSEYAEISLAMRNGTNPAGVFDRLLERGQVVVHPDEQTRTEALVTTAAASGALVVADTREQVADLNHAIREHHLAHGRVDDQHTITTTSGDHIGIGDRITTRHNDPDLGVANRDTWTVTGVTRTGGLHLTGRAGTRDLPADYVNQHVELAYASTVYGAQGQTTRAAHLVLGEHTGAAAAYVAMTRGRDTNTAHLVANDLDNARDQWAHTFARDRADLGPAHATRLAEQESAQHGLFAAPSDAYRRITAARHRRKSETMRVPESGPDR